MSDEIIQILKALQSSGQTGILILIVVLLVVIAASVWMIWQQKRAITLFKESQGIIDQKLKSVESNIKSADSLREESRKSQEFSQKTITDRIDSLVKINDELRKEVDRLDKKQVEFQKSVKDAITIGIADLKERINHTSVNELLESIPREFRNDMEQEIIGASERVVNHFIIKLRDTPDDLIDQESIQKVVKNAISRVIPHFVDPRVQEEIEYHIRRGAPPEWILERYGEYYPYHYMFSERYIDILAEKIADRIRRKYW